MGGEGFPLLPILWICGKEAFDMGQRKQYDSRLRMDTGQHHRILMTMLVLGIAVFLLPAARLYDLMVRQADRYSALALRNQTRSTRVSARR